MGECMMQADVRALPELGTEWIGVPASTSGRDGAGLVMDGHLREGVVNLSDAHVVVILAVCVPAAEGEGTRPATHDTAA
eukprot:scaffold34722_cov45-Phaeocystis_antarctica.AAC.1